MKYLSGSCLCGKVKIQVPDAFEYVGHCHCSECRKFSGAAFATAGGVGLSKLKILEGESALTYYQKSEETDLAFCNACGSSLFSKKRKTNMCNIRFGVFDDVPTEKPTFHIFVGSKAPWFEITDDLKQFDERP